MDLERYLGKYLTMFVHAYNPDRYVQLIEHSWGRFIKFFLVTLLIALSLFILTFIPISVQYINALPETFEGVREFNVSADIQADGPVVILANPRIVLDLNESETLERYDLLITPEGIVYPRFVFFGKTSASWSDIGDLKRPTESRDNLLFGLVVFLLPSILFWFALASLLKVFAAFFILVFLGYYVPKLLKHRITLSETVKVAILAMPSAMLIGMGLSPLAPRMLFWWGVLLTTILFAIGITLLSERIIRRDTKYKR